MQFLNPVLVALVLTFGLAHGHLGAQESAKREDIEQLLQLTGARAIGLRTTNQVIARFQAIHPDVPDEVWQVVRDEAAARVDDFVSERVVPIYEEYLTHDEIKELLAFYQSPLGQKLLRVLPQMSQESLRAGQAWGLEFADAVQEQLAAKGYK